MPSAKRMRSWGSWVIHFADEGIGVPGIAQAPGAGPGEGRPVPAGGFMATSCARTEGRAPNPQPGPPVSSELTDPCPLLRRRPHTEAPATARSGHAGKASARQGRRAAGVRMRAAPPDQRWAPRLRPSPGGCPSCGVVLRVRTIPARSGLASENGGRGLKAVRMLFLWKPNIFLLCVGILPAADLVRLPLVWSFISFRFSVRVVQASLTFAM